MNHARSANLPLFIQREIQEERSSSSPMLAAHCPSPGFVEYVEHARGAALSEQSRVAASIQRQMAKLILEFLQDSVPANKGTNLCLGGGLFYNTYFNSAVRRKSASCTMS